MKQPIATHSDCKPQVDNEAGIPSGKSEDDDLLRIDLEAVLRDRLPRQSRFIPRFLVRQLERFICQDRLNRLLEQNHGLQGGDFCRGVLRDLNVTYRVIGEENLPPVDNRRVVIASNHPLGGLDGIILIDYFSRRYGNGLKFVVNDLLMAIKPLRPVFLPVNKYGRQSREEVSATSKVFEGNDPIVVFPAGLCSRMYDGGVIKDPKWQKSFLQRSIDYQRDIIPVYFHGENSPFFYKFAKLRQRMGIKFNVELIDLPREMFKKENAEFTVSIAPAIAWSSLKGGADAQRETEQVRQIIYNLKN